MRPPSERPGRLGHSSAVWSLALQASPEARVTEQRWECLLQGCKCIGPCLHASTRFVELNAEGLAVAVEDGPVERPIVGLC